MEYQIIRSQRKTIAIQITPEGNLVVRCPSRMKTVEVDKFVESKRDWIASHLKKRPPVLQPFSEVEVKALASRAKQVIPARVAYFAPRVGVTYGSITIRSQRTRWGSCSSKGNLNFNCLLMLVPPQVLDYVVVHELCHRKQMNHSARFWAEVERIVPDWRVHRKWLKDNGNSLIGRLPK